MAEAHANWDNKTAFFRLKNQTNDADQILWNIDVRSSTADIHQDDGYVRFVPIVLQNSFWITEDKFSGLWAQRTNNRVGDRSNW